MIAYRAEQAESALTELKSYLHEWHHNQGSDSISTRGRQQRLYEASKLAADRLIYGLQPERRLQLKVGETAIQAFRFHKRGGGRRGDTDGVMLGPGEQLQLRNTVLATDIPSQDEELYAGFVVKTPLSEIARTLEEGGELSIIGASRPPEN